MGWLSLWCRPCTQQELSDRSQLPLCHWYLHAHIQGNERRQALTTHIKAYLLRELCLTRSASKYTENVLCFSLFFTGYFPTRVTISTRLWPESLLPVVFTDNKRQGRKPHPNRSFTFIVNRFSTSP